MPARGDALTSVIYLGVHHNSYGRYEVYQAPNRQAALEFLRQKDVRQEQTYVIVETPEGSLGRDLVMIFAEDTGAMIEFGRRTPLPERLRSTQSCTACGYTVPPAAAPEADTTHYLALDELKEEGLGFYCPYCNTLWCTFCAAFQDSTPVCGLCGSPVTLFSEVVQRSQQDLPRAGEEVIPPGLVWLIESAGVHFERFQQNGSPADLEAAADHWESLLSHPALEWAPLAFRLDCYNDGGTFFLARYQAQGQPGDTERGIRLLEKAAELAHEGDSRTAAILANLSAAYSQRFDRSKNAADIQAAIQGLTQALSLPGLAAERRGQILGNQAENLHKRFEVSQDLADVDEAIRLLGGAATDFAPGSPELEDCLNNLGLALRHRYDHLGSTADLHAAIEAYEKAIESAAASPALPSILNNLANSLIARFLQSGDLDDLAQAVSAYQNAIESTPRDSPQMPPRLTGLGNALRLRAAVLDDLEALNEAIHLFQRAADQGPQDEAERYIMLHNLGVGLSERYNETNEIDDLERAIQAFRSAVHSIPTQSSERPAALANLGLALGKRYEHAEEENGSGDPVDLDESLELIRQAVEQTPPDSPARPSRLYNLGLACSVRFRARTDPADLQSGQAAFEQACRSGLASSPEVVLHSGWEWGNWAEARRTWPEAARAYRWALEAAGALFQAQSLRASKESRLIAVQGLPERAAYALARAGDLQGAVLALEHGRARLLSETLALQRADLSQLERDHPEMASRFRQAADRLAALQAAELSQRGGSGDLSGQIRSSYRELEAVLSAIRRQQGFQDFLKPVSFARIQEAAKPDPLVYTAVTPAGGLCLIVSAAGEIRPLWLDSLSTQALQARLHGREGPAGTGGYLGAFNDWRRDPRAPHALAAWQFKLDEALRWLWLALAKPLARTVEEAGIRRVVLIPSGLLGLFPLHAAWTDDLRRPNRRLYAQDLIQFRYAPDAQALLAARETDPRPTSSTSVLAVLNPDGTMAYAPLELAALLEHFPADGQTVLGRDANRRSVLAALGRTQLLHFSTHGWVEQDDPLSSALALAGGERLELRDFLQVRLQQARLVVLSACETGVPGAQLPDEVISLAAGLSQAGAAGVVSSLWAVPQMSTALLLDRFYHHLLHEQAQPADALHLAQDWLRKVQAAELRDYFDILRRKGGPHYTIYSAAWRRFLTLPAHERPYNHPYHWAGFTFTGAA